MRRRSRSDRLLVTSHVVCDPLCLLYSLLQLFLYLITVVLYHVPSLKCLVALVAAADTSVVTETCRARPKERTFFFFFFFFPHKASLRGKYKVSSTCFSFPPEKEQSRASLKESMKVYMCYRWRQRDQVLSVSSALYVSVACLAWW